MISSEQIRQINSLPILGVAERLKLDVDSHRRCLCPFHEEDTPSLVFYPSSNSFFCFACRHHGGVIDLAMKVLGKGFVETCLWLSSASVNEQISCYSSNLCSKKEFNASKYERYFEHPFLNKKSSEFLFTQRKLNPNVIEWLRLSSYRDNLQIPYFDINGRLIGVQFRNLGSSGPRFYFPQGSSCHIYNLPILNYLSPGEELYIAEGCSDCWALLSSGHKAIAIPSATLLKIQDLKVLEGLNLHMFPDQDAPGEQLYQQLCKSLPIIRHQLPLGCKDYSDFYLQNVNRKP